VRRSILLLALQLACRPSDPAPAPTTAIAAPEPQPQPAPAAAAPSTQAAAPSTQDAAPQTPKLPDGAAIAACEEAPANMSCIPGGPFVRGSDDGPENARPAATIALQTFYMDQYEVTIAEYKACVKSGECRKGGPFYPDFSRPHQPIVGMNWFGARDFCTAHGKSLPTEAQWEKAARGTEGAKYAWGDEPATCRRAVIRDKKGRSCGIPMNRSSEPYKGRTFVVGSRPAGAHDLFDMTGNAWEYVADWYSESWSACGDACAGVDPKGPCGGADECPGFDHKLVKGGSWYWGPDYATSYYRRPQPPTNSPFHHFGFRCAASVEQAKALRGKPRDPLAPVPGERNEDAQRGL
jgi:formylglycine-generating enzyme required for sulfatase activity